MTTPGYMARALARDDDMRPTTMTADEVRRWRITERLTQPTAASIAGVDRVTWARWEGGTVDPPQWLSDVLAYRWGSAPGDRP